jgi:hypothetical protein
MDFYLHVVKKDLRERYKIGKIALGFEFWRNSRTTSVAGLWGLVEFEIPFEIKKKNIKKKIATNSFSPFSQ